MRWKSNTRYVSPFFKCDCGKQRQLEKKQYSLVGELELMLCQFSGKPVEIRDPNPAQVSEHLDDLAELDSASFGSLIKVQDEPMDVCA